MPHVGLDDGLHHACITCALPIQMALTWTRLWRLKEKHKGLIGPIWIWFFGFFCLLFFQKLYHYIQVPIMKTNLKSNLKIIYNFNKLTFIFAFLANSSSISFHSAIKCRTSPSTQFFPMFSTFSPSSSSSFIVTIITFFFVVLFLGRGVGLGISCKSKSPSIHENECFNPPWPKLYVLTSETHSFWAFPRIWNALLQTTTLCGSTKPTMPTLNVFKNGMVGVYSTMSSSIHEMSSICA